MSITLFFGGFNSVQNAVVARNLQFKKYFFSSLIAIVISAVVGIIMAYLQFGVWALVTQQLVNIFIICLVLWFTVEWRPKACFSFKKIKILFSYGWKLLCSSLIDALYTNLYDLVIGKKYASDTLAFYNRGKQFPYMIVNNLNSSISSVLLPVMSIKQDDNEAVKKMVRKSIKMSSFLVFPVMIGLAIVAKPLILLILTDKWLECVPFLQMLCICYAFWPMHTANLQAINALGRSDIFLKLEIIKKIFGIIILIASIPFGVYAMCIGQVISSIFASVVNAFPNKKLLNYSYIEQIKDMLPYFIISICMGLVVWIISFLNISNIAMLILQVFIGGLFYIIISALFKIESYQYILDLIKKNRS